MAWCAAQTVLCHPDQYGGNGYALYAFDLTADLGEDDHFSLLRQGSVRLALKFAQALPQTVTVVAYAEFENVIEIDRDRNVVFDFGGDRTVPATAPGRL